MTPNKKGADGARRSFLKPADMKFMLRRSESQRLASA
jgi:hypothetical protein